MLLTPGSHRVLHQSKLAVVTVFVAQLFEDAFRRVSLFPMNLPIADQDLFNDRQEGIQLRKPIFRLTISGRLRVLQHLRQSLPMNTILAARRPFTQFARQNAATNFTPKFHVGNHSAHPPRPETPEIRQNDAFPCTIQTQQVNK